MKKLEAMSVVKSVVAEFIQKGIVDNGDRDVQKGGLYALIN